MLNHRTKRNLIFASPLLLVSLAAVLAPRQILESAPVLRACVEQLELWFGFIEGYADLSLYPQITRFTLASAMLLAILFAAPFGHYQLRAQESRRAGRYTALRRWGWIAAPLALLPFVMPGPTLDQAAHSIAFALLLGREPLALAVFASALAIFEMSLLAWLLMWFRTVFRPSARTQP